MHKKLALTAFCLLLIALAIWTLSFGTISWSTATTLSYIVLVAIAGGFTTFVAIELGSNIRGRIATEVDEPNSCDNSSSTLDENVPDIDENSSDAEVLAVIDYYRLDDLDRGRWHDDGGALGLMD